jgi:toxin ParE1/3/4
VQNSNAESVAELWRLPQARKDLDDIWFHIAEDSPSAADRLLRRFERAELRLADFPASAQRRDDLRPGLRMLPVGNYLILYCVEGEEVLVVRYIHGAREIGEALDGP